MGKIVPILFAPAEDTLFVTGIGELRSVRVGPKNQFTFGNVNLLARPIPKTSLIKLTDDKPISRDFIRTYAICGTPRGIWRRKRREYFAADSEVYDIEQIRKSRTIPKTTKKLLSTLVEVRGSFAPNC